MQILQRQTSREGLNLVNPFCATHQDYRVKSTIKKIRIPFMKREKAAIIKLRNLGYSITTLQTFTGRSRSVIHKIINGCIWIKTCPHQDLRNIPNATRKTAAQNHRLTIHRYMQLWEAFILGETDKPP